MALDISVLRRSADVYDPNSFANRLRSARFRQFEKMAASLPRPLRILDVGGTSEFWENGAGPDAPIARY